LLLSCSAAKRSSFLFLPGAYIKWESVTFCQPFVKVLLKTWFSGLKNNRWVGDFQVATGGGFWVATRGSLYNIDA